VLSWGAKRSLAALLPVVPLLVVSCGGQNGPTVGEEPTPDAEAAVLDGAPPPTSDASGAQAEDGEAPDDASSLDGNAPTEASPGEPPEASLPDATLDGVDASALDAALLDAGHLDASALDSGKAADDASLDDASVDAAGHDHVDAGADAGAAAHDASLEASPPDGAPDATLEAGEGSPSDDAGAEEGPGWTTGDGGLAFQVVADGGALADGGSPQVECLALATQDLALDPTRAVLYASVAGSSSVFGNSVVRVDPSSLSVTGSVFVGSNPNALAVTDDAASLYVGIDGAFSVVAVDLASGDVGTPVYLGASEYDGARSAGEIRAVPGSATRYVVSRKTSESDPSFSGLALYDGATLLGQWNGATGGESIAFASPTVLYGYDNEDSSFDLYAFTVGSSGFTVDSDTMGLVQGYGAEIESQGGWIFATTGQAVDGATGDPVGQYDATGPVWPDPNGADVWFLDGAGAAPVLYDFDRTLFTAKRSFTLTAGLLGGGATSLVAWSSTGLAFRTATAVCVVTVPPG
jgi:hypothetical protein